MEMLMWKKVLLASAVTGLLAGAAIPIHPNTAYAAHSGCAEAAKMRFPADPTARKEFKHWCKDQWKLYKASHKGQL
jgi:hypothetical protein